MNRLQDLMLFRDGSMNHIKQHDSDNYPNCDGLLDLHIEISITTKINDEKTSK